VKPLDWQALLVDGYEPLRTAQRVFRRLPSDPRCKLCRSPFGGIGGRVVGWMGRRPSRKNPNLCQACFDRLPPGGIEVDVGVVFADLRGSTGMGEQSTATAFASRLNHFYATASAVVLDHDGLVDKLIGDEVMGLFIQGITGADYRRQTARAAIALAAALRDLPVGVAANAGAAFVGNVGAGTVLDFTALGDAVNVGARLQEHAAPNAVVLAEALYDALGDDRPVGRRELLDVRGRDAPVAVAVIGPDDGDVDASANA
jgi:adenylate cyclase